MENDIGKYAMLTLKNKSKTTNNERNRSTTSKNY